jgi:hypothetical protein
LSHLWQRFLLATALVVGLFIGIAGTIFGYSNNASVDVHWSIFHLDAVPLWTVAVIPLVLVLVAGTLYHWMDGLHHFSEHMRHRHRVHELEAEVKSLRAHLDQVLDMPDHSTSRLPHKSVTVDAVPVVAPTEPATLPETAPETPAPRRLARPKSATLAVAAEPVAPPAINGGHETAPAEPAH